ncbi:MAG: metalloregulator ArsR/SmtB family transcription factor [Anaerovoracaceae bacterium]|nr:metalloregulator ArsR/SmtB family transcription factor [Bacillota bacterium]MDY5976333.1 metalloregulator ArsR/SmtB family transcription factor [Anaerovoracaceae bacterium]
MRELPHNHGTSHEFLEARPDEEIFGKASDMFSLIGDSTRLKILWILCHSEECVINIAAAIDMSSPAVSHHLKVLKQNGIIVSRREGKEAYYRLADTQEAKIIHEAVDKMLDIKCGLTG